MLRIVTLAIIFTALLCLSRGAARAELIASDTFETGDHPTGTRTVVAGSLNGIVFQTRNAGSLSSIVSDSSFGSTKALSFSDTDGSTSTNGAIIGLLPVTLTLNNVNDFVSLSFKVRFTNVGDGNASNFRFGFFSSNGTAVTADNTASSDNDQGYYAVFGASSAPASNNVFFNESGGISQILGGTDRSNVTASATGFSLGTTVHSVLFTATRTSATDITLALQLDGGTAITGVSSSSLRTAFDEIAFSTGFGSSTTSLNIDDVLVNATVPEPSAALLAGAGMLTLLSSRRRRKNN